MSLSAGRVGVRADQVDSHGRVISPSFLNEIMEDLPEWTDLPVRVNGTEQLIPSNPSVPVTSPILADIDYPDERRNDQYFTYRESPTTVDGLAKIKGIKGNTLVWNQLVNTNTSSVILTSGHKFITKVGGTFSLVEGTGQSLSVTGGTDEVFDLTLMFGVGNEPTTVDEFTSLFPLSYYAYNSGSLLSFNGTAIKTTGKNYFNTAYVSEDVNSRKANGQIDAYITQSLSYLLGYTNTTLATLPGGTYTLRTSSSTFTNVYLALSDGTNWSSGETKTFTSSIGIKAVRCNTISLTVGTYYWNVLINEGNSIIENTTNLPTETYFPTGMKSAGTVYDELLPTKAITRIGVVDLGSLSWYYTSGGQGRFATGGISSTVKPVTSNTEVANIKNAKYSTISAGLVYNGNTGIAIDNAGAIWVYDTTYGTDSSAFRTAMSGVYLYYELATPVELPTLSFE